MCGVLVDDTGNIKIPHISIEWELFIEIPVLPTDIGDQNWVLNSLPVVQYLATPVEVGEKIPMDLDESLK